MSGEALADQRPATRGGRGRPRAAAWRGGGRIWPWGSGCSSSRWPTIIRSSAPTASSSTSTSGCSSIRCASTLSTPWRRAVPLWTPDIFLGVPFFANAQTALLYPLKPSSCYGSPPRLCGVAVAAYLAGRRVHLPAGAGRAAPGPGRGAGRGVAFSLGGFLTGLTSHLNQAQRAHPPAARAAAARCRGPPQPALDRRRRGGARLADAGGPHPGGVPVAGRAGSTRRAGAVAGRRRRFGNDVSPAARASSRLARPTTPSSPCSGWRSSPSRVVPTAELQREGIRGVGWPIPRRPPSRLPPDTPAPGAATGLLAQPIRRVRRLRRRDSPGLALLALAVAPPRWALVGACSPRLGLALASAATTRCTRCSTKSCPGLGLFRVQRAGCSSTRLAWRC